MKRHPRLFEHIVSFDNLLLAARNAQKGKRFRPSTARFNFELEKELVTLQRELKNRNYRHGGYDDFRILDPKPRLISAAPYRDRVVHHALCNVIDPLFDVTFIHDSYACRQGKGTHAAVDRYTEFSRKNAWVLKCDIQKYFHAVDHDILFGLIQRKIKCRDTLWLIRTIIDSRNDESLIHYFPGDDMFTPYERKRGIPIGNLTSQFFANIYLNGFDHFIKQTLKCRHYIRYVDDFVVFHPEKAFLHHVKAEMTNYLNTLRLRLHPKKCQLHRVSDGVPFLGYRIFPTHRLLNARNSLTMRRRMRTMARSYRNGEIPLDKIQQRIQSWIGHAAHADTWNLRGRILGGVSFQRDDAERAAGRFVEQRNRQRGPRQPQREPPERTEQQCRAAVGQYLKPPKGHPARPSGAPSGAGHAGCGQSSGFHGNRERAHSSPGGVPGRPSAGRNQNPPRSGW